MKICLTTKLEISKEKEIAEMLKFHFPNCNINIMLKPRKYKKKKANKPVKQVVKVARKVKPKKPRKQMTYYESEWLKDYYYNKSLQEDGIKQIVQHYSKIRELEGEYV